MKTRFEVAADEDGLRLDQVIPRHVAGLSRRKARAVIDTGGVFVERARVKVAGRPVRAGQTIEVHTGGAVDRGPPPAPRIVFADEHVIVADKPAGLVTAPTPESDRGDLLDQLARRYGEVYLVHRIDLPTSGLLVFARTRDANKRLGDAFVAHDIERDHGQQRIVSRRHFREIHDAHALRARDDDDAERRERRQHESDDAARRAVCSGLTHRGHFA